MAYLIVNVESAQGWGINPDLMLVHATVSWVDANTNTQQAGFDLPMPATSSAETINEAVRTQAVATAAAHGITLGPTDVVRVFAGAVPNIS
jgi:hypothetical protein